MVLRLTRVERAPWSSARCRPTIPKSGNPTSPWPAQVLGWEPEVSLEQASSGRSALRTQLRHDPGRGHRRGRLHRSHLVGALAGRGDEVIGIDNFDPFYPRRMKAAQSREIGQRPEFCFYELDMLEVRAGDPAAHAGQRAGALAGKAGVRPVDRGSVGYAR